MEKIKKNFGFGCMRLPMTDGEVDYAEMNRMVDLFLAKGFNYFDTAHGYLGGKVRRLCGNVWSSVIPESVIS